MSAAVAVVLSIESTTIFRNEGAPLSGSKVRVHLLNIGMCSLNAVHPADIYEFLRDRQSS